MKSAYPILRTGSQLTFPVVLVFAADHIVNAHSGPGEGFSGGLLVALAVLLLYIGIGIHTMERVLGSIGRLGIIAGLLACLAAGGVGLFFGRGFLDNWTATPKIAGETLHASISAIFDLGIFLLVSTGTISIFRSLGLGEEDEK